MLDFLFPERVICPYCLAEIRGGKNLQQCPQCKGQIPVLYRSSYKQHQPFFVQVFGWSRVGKTVYLQALTLMLIRMAKLWPNFTHSAATNITQLLEKDINEYLFNGKLPPATPLGLQDAYIMVLNNMPRWGGRTLVTRDCAGEIFDNLQIPVEQAPYLLNVPTAFMFISLADLPNSGGHSINMLMTNYINTLLNKRVDFSKEKRSIVVVLTKGDIIPELPLNLRQYLQNDPLWSAVNSPNSTPQMDLVKMAEYLEEMERVDRAISDWIQRDAAGKVFVRLAKDNNITLRFSIISSTGASVGSDNTLPASLSPRRVLDPYFWALELQSR